MAENAEESVTVAVMRIAARLPGMQVPTDAFLQRKISGLVVGDLQTRSLRTPEVSIEEAADETNQLLERYKGLVEQDVRTVQELLRLNANFRQIPWVAEAAERLERSPRAKQKQGRPKWLYAICPEVILALVTALRERGKAKSNRGAAKWLEISGLLSSSRVLSLLKKIKKDPRLKPTLCHPPIEWQAISNAKLTRIFDKAIVAREGETLRFELSAETGRFHHVFTENPANLVRKAETND